MNPPLPHPVTRRTLLKLAIAGSGSLSALVLVPDRASAVGIPEVRAATRRRPQKHHRRRATDSTASHQCLRSRHWGDWKRCGLVRVT